MSKKPERNNAETQQGTNQFHQVLNTYRPYWPVFLILFVLSILYTIYYLKTTAPTYAATASILIKDEKKGEEYSKMEQMLNMFGNKNIVENQVEVISSLPVLTEAVRELNLSTPVYAESGWKGHKVVLAYESCPIEVIAKNPDKLVSPQINKIYFQWNTDKSTVKVENKTYPVGEWVKTPWDTLMFAINPRYSAPVPSKEKTVVAEEATKYFFSVVNERGMAKVLESSFRATAKNKLATIIELRISDPNPKRAEAILNEIVAAYHRQTAEKTNEVARNTLLWIESRLANVSQEIDSLESGIQTYRTGEQLVDVGEQGRGALQGAQQTEQLLNTYELQLSALNEVEKYISSRESGNLAASTFNLTDNSLRDLMDRLAIAESKYRTLKPTTGENSPIMIAAREDVEKTKQMILDNVAGQKNSIKAGMNKLRNIKAEYSSRLTALPKKERDLLDVSRSRTTKNEIYSFLLGKKEEIAFSLTSPEFSSYFVNKPSATAGPVSPNINLIAIMALLLPLGFGAGAISLREFLSSKLLYRSDLEKLTSLPIAGEIVFEKIDYSLSPARSFAIEQFRHLRHALKYFIENDTVLKRVLVTSSVMGEGKSYVSMNLARSLARSGKKVALLEMDLHKPKLREYFGIEGEIPGIIDYLTGNANEKEIIVPIESQPNLFIIPSGTPNEDASELLVQPNFEILLNYLDTQFDILVIDSAPVKAISDGYLIAQHVQLTLFVMRHNHTPKTAIQQLEEEMSMRNIHPVALVFNGIKKRGFGKFSYGKGHGYGYDNKVTYDSYNKKKRK